MRRLAFRLAPALPSRPLTLIDITFSARLNEMEPLSAGLTTKFCMGCGSAENALQCDKAARDFQHRDLAGNVAERDGISSHCYANTARQADRSSVLRSRYVRMP